jgi:hypothetical protein
MSKEERERQEKLRKERELKKEAKVEVDIESMFLIMSILRHTSAY